MSNNMKTYVVTVSKSEVHDFCSEMITLHEESFPSEQEALAFIEQAEARADDASLIFTYAEEESFL